MEEHKREEHIGIPNKSRKLNNKLTSLGGRYSE